MARIELATELDPASPRRTRMRRPLNAMILALAATECLAQGTDPLTSPACVRALDALQAQEAAMLSSGRPPGLRAQEQRNWLR